MFSGGFPPPTVSIENAQLDGPLSSSMVNWSMAGGAITELLGGVESFMKSWFSYEAMNRQYDAIDKALAIKDDLRKDMKVLQEKALDYQYDLASKSQDTAVTLAREERLLEQHKIDAQKDVAIRKAELRGLNETFAQPSYFRGSPAYAS